MRTVRFRLTGTVAKTDAMIAALHSIDGVDRVEEVADQMHERDDSSSLQLPGDSGGDFHDIEVHAHSAAEADAVRSRAEIAARDLGVAVEFVEEF
ncbi:MAG TPA: hypothetical protein VFV97_08390 [Rhodanobacteraceae bacterium]|nr:hypothetical protein [Rhodanobacteraceae bacterium]